MVGWAYRLNGPEFEKALGDGEVSAGDLVSIPGLGRKIMDLNLVFSESRENLLLKLIMTILW